MEIIFEIICMFKLLRVETKANRNILHIDTSFFVCLLPRFIQPAGSFKIHLFLGSVHPSPSKLLNPNRRALLHKYTLALQINTGFCVPEIQAWQPGGEFLMLQNCVLTGRSLEQDQTALYVLELQLKIPASSQHLFFKKTTLKI